MPGSEISKTKRHLERQHMEIYTVLNGYDIKEKLYNTLVGVKMKSRHHKMNGNYRNVCSYED